MAEISPKGQTNTVEKGEIADYEPFLLFPRCFQKDLYCRHITATSCLDKSTMIVLFRPPEFYAVKFNNEDKIPNTKVLGHMFKKERKLTTLIEV